ncbi:hypothetical protein ACFW4X_30185 [Streptomyces smyrnaeus]|uniref:hypothetical protein n=1 Tax=Streptomyces smyrnaeus TaxID=1387713 RepID=UPI0033E9CAFC
MRIRTAIAAGALSAVALLGTTAGTAVANDGPKKSPSILDLGVNACGINLIPALSVPQSYCKNTF